MRYFTLIAAAVSAPRNRVFRKEDKDVIPETAWQPGKADELVLAGFIKEVESTEKKEVVIDEPIKVKEVVKEIPLFVAEEKTEEKKEEVKYNLSPVVEISAITKDSIKNELTDNNIEFSDTLNKKALYDLWISLPR